MVSHTSERGQGGVLPRALGEKGDGEMFARVSTYEGRPEQLDEMHHEGLEHVLPALEMQDGYSGGLVLADRQSGKVLAVTLWESEQAMKATEDASEWLRIFSAESARGTISSVQRYEVLYSAIQETSLSERSGESRSTEARRLSETSSPAQDAPSAISHQQKQETES
jgi:heme-degrading monooxygenase HmoA